MTKTVQLKHRFTDAVLYTTDVDDNDETPVRTAMQRAAFAGVDQDLLRRIVSEADEVLEDEDASDEDKAIARLHKEGAEREIATPSARANLDGANLARANLARANLARANLDGANLARANLARANLARANLARAYLDGANLDGANLDRANLDGANLDGANLARANLARANLARAYLARAYLDGANLDGANLDGARGLPEGFVATDPPEPYRRPVEHVRADREYALQYRARHPEVPVVEQLDARILARVEGNPSCFDMSMWHSRCQTTHCRAGHAVDLAGPAGYELERKLGSSAHAGAQIYLASVGFVPWFYDPSTEHALEDIRRCAAEQLAAEVKAETPAS